MDIQEFSIQKSPLWLRLTVQTMGRDLCVLIGGGKSPAQRIPDTADGPHVGAVALAQPCPSTTGAGKSASASVLALHGHKEDLLARALALQVATYTGVNVVLVCGIHADNATPAQIACFESMAHELVAEMLHHFDLSQPKDSPCYA